MNKQETDIFFALLRNALFGHAIKHETWSNNWSWKPIIDVIDFHVLQTLMAEPILLLPEHLRPSVEVQSEYMQMVAMNIVDHNRQNNDIEKTFRLLEANGFRPVLLKGQGNATFYPKPMLRKVGDVDLYVGERDCEAVCSLLLSSINGTKSSHDSEKHKVIHKDATEFEVHKFSEKQFYPQCDDAYQLVSDGYMRKCDTVLINGYKIKIPPKQFLPLYLFNHLWMHFKIGAVGFRQYVDLAVVLHKIYSKIDNSILEDELCNCGLLLEWKCVGPLLVHLMGLPANEFPLYEDMGEKKARAFAELVFLDGNFNYKKNYKGRISHLWCSVKKFTKRSYLLSKVSYPLALRVFLGAFVRGVKNIFQKGKDW